MSRRARIANGLHFRAHDNVDQSDVVADGRNFLLGAVGEIYTRACLTGLRKSAHRKQPFPSFMPSISPKSCRQDSLNASAFWLR